MVLKGVYSGGRIVGVRDTNKGISREATPQEKVINQPIQKTTSSGGGGGKSIATTTPQQIIIAKSPVKESLKPTTEQTPYLIQQQVAIQKFKTERGTQNIPETKVFYVDPSTNTRRVATQEEYEYFRSQQKKELQARVELKGEKFVRRTKEKIIEKGQLQPVIKAYQSGSATFERNRLIGESGRELVNKANLKIGETNINVGSIKQQVSRVKFIGGTVASFIPDTPLGIATTYGGIKYFGVLKQRYRIGIVGGAGVYGGIRTVGASSKEEAISGLFVTGISAYGLRREAKIFRENYSINYVSSQTQRLPLTKNKEFVTAGIIKGSDIKIGRTLIKTIEAKGLTPKTTRGLSAGNVRTLEKVTYEIPQQTFKGTISSRSTSNISATQRLGKINRVTFYRQQTLGAIAKKKGSQTFGYEGYTFKVGNRSFSIGVAKTDVGNLRFKKSLIIQRDLFLRDNVKRFKIIPLTEKSGQLTINRPKPLSTQTDINTFPTITPIVPRFELSSSIKSNPLKATLPTKNDRVSGFKPITITTPKNLFRDLTFTSQLPRNISSSRSKSRARQTEITPQIFKPLNISQTKLKSTQRITPIEKLITTQTPTKVPKNPIIITPPRKNIFIVPPFREGTARRRTSPSFLVSVKSPRGFRTLARTRTPTRAINIGVGRVRRTRETTFKITPIRSKGLSFGTPKGFTRKGFTFSEKINLGKIRI